MRALVSVALACATLWCGQGHSGVAGPQVLGRAFSPDGDSLLYTEYHWRFGIDHLVEYSDPDGALIAKNRLRYVRDSPSPAQDQYDMRSGVREGAIWRGDDLYLFRSDEERPVSASGTLVISSGFDGFVRDHWEALASGRSVNLEFAVPARLRTIELRARKLGSDACPDATEHGWTCFRVEPVSRLLRWLSAPIELAYDERRRLRVYSGLSNLRDAGGNSLQVLIRYEHPEQPVYPVPDLALCEPGPLVPRFC